MEDDKDLLDYVDPGCWPNRWKRMTGEAPKVVLAKVGRAGSRKTTWIFEDKVREKDEVITFDEVKASRHFMPGMRD